MTLDSNMGGGSPSRQMYDVSALGLKCAGCGAVINQLPFQPSGDRPIYCRECNSNRNKGNTFTGNPRPPRQMYDVSAMDLKCGTCNTDILELPFQPSGDRPVYCRDCNSNRTKKF